MTESEYVSVETRVTGEGVCMTVYHHDPEDAVVLTEFWRSWGELGVILNESPDETLASDLLSAELEFED